MITQTTVFQIPPHCSLSGARVLFLEEVNKKCRLVTDKVEVNATTDGISLKLYNEGIRPTVYHVIINMDKYLEATSLTIETIYYKKDHTSLKTSFSIKEAQHIVNLLETLSRQPCDGSKELTLKRFTPLGMMYWEDPKNKDVDA